MWMCCNKEYSRKIYPEQSYNWYINTQKSINQAYDQRLIKCESCKNPYQFQNYARIKIKSKNLQDIYMDLRNNRENFQDLDFTHVYYNISRDQKDNKDIQWKRVGQLVKNAVYSLPANNKSYLATFKTSHKALETCLTLISRTHPRKLQTIRNHKTSQQGLYEFKLFKNGIIHNVIVDDYVPSYKGVYIFTGPANDVQVYPMLLEKAIAKICEGYSQMPTNPLDIMQMIYCGAITRQNLQDLRNLQQLKQLVNKTLARDGLTIVISKKDKKVLQYGINDSQIYQIINQHQIRLSNGQQHTLYEIISQNRLSAWNGAFRIADPIWKQVNPQIKQKVFQAIKTNQSFVIVDKEIHRLFEGLVVFQDTQKMNKDWLQNFSASGYPSFCSFKLKQKDTVFLRITTKTPIKQSLILCRILNEQYRLIGGNFDQNVEYLQYSQELEPGDYIICVLQEWISKKEGQYVIYLSSTIRTALVQQISQISNFLQKLFISHSSLSNKQSQPVFYQSIRQIGFGYLRVFVKPPSQIKKIKINHNKIKQDQWQILQPYSDMPEIITTQSVLVVMKMLRKKPRELCSFPIQAFHIT